VSPPASRRSRGWSPRCSPDAASRPPAEFARTESQTLRVRACQHKRARHEHASEDGRCHDTDELEEVKGVDVEEGQELGECQVDDLVAIRYHLKTACQQRSGRVMRAHKQSSEKVKQRPS
jgi:hypothetical protein